MDKSTSRMSQHLLSATLLSALMGAASASDDARRADPSAHCTAAYCSRFDRLRDRIRQSVQAGEPVSLALAVGVEGEIVWEEAFGWADRERRIRARADTIYPVASVSKPITATGLLILVERGKVSLDKPIGAYLGDAQLQAYAGASEGATVRRVLQHRAGLPRHGQYFLASERTMPLSPAETIKRYGIIVNEPGSKYQYSNLGFGMLAYVTARASQRNYAEFMLAEVFGPLGLTRTSVQIEPTPTVQAAVSYAPDGSPLPYYTFDEWGSGRVFSTVHDLARFGLFHLKEPLAGARRILSDRTIDTMVNDRETTGTVGGRYGLDWFYALEWGGRERSKFGPYWYGHDGGMPGVSSSLKLLPDQRLVVVAVSNSRSSLPEEATDAVIDTLLPQFRAARLADPSLNPPSSESTFTVSPELVGTWPGEVRTWQGRLAAQLRITRDVVYLRVGDQAEVAVERAALADNRFTGRAAGTLATADIRPHPHHLELDLALRNDAMTGVIRVTGEPPMFYVDLPSWIELKKTATGR